ARWRLDWVELTKCVITTELQRRRQEEGAAGVQSRSWRCRSRTKATGPIGPWVRTQPRLRTLRPTSLQQSISRQRVGHIDRCVGPRRANATVEPAGVALRESLGTDSTVE